MAMSLPCTQCPITAAKQAQFGVSVVCARPLPVTGRQQVGAKGISSPWLYLCHHSPHWHSMLQRAFPADCGVCFGYCWPNPWLPRGALGVMGSQPSLTSSQASAELWSGHRHSTGNGSTSEEQCGQGCHCPCCATHGEQPCFLLLMSRHIILIKILFQ